MKLLKILIFLLLLTVSTEKKGAYAAIKVNGEYVGAPDRARSYQSNTWEYVNAAATSNYTYYFPADRDYAGKNIEIFVFAYQDGLTDLEPEVWISAGSKTV